MKYSLISTLTFVHFFKKSLQTICFEQYFPRVLGGSSDNTMFYAMDIDSSGNVVAAGGSHDNGVLSDTGNPPNPIIAYYYYGGLTKWAYELNPNNGINNIKQVTFDTTGSYIAGIFDDAVLYGFIMNLSPSVTSTFYDT